MNRPNPSQTFLNEAEDLLTQIEDVVLEIQPGSPPGEAVHQIFRAFHTLKGSGAMFGFDSVAAFTHHVETVLDKVRDGVVPVSAELIDLILASKDEIKALLDAAQKGAARTSDHGAKIVSRLTALLPSVPEAAPAPGGVSAPAASSASGSSQTFRIHFRPPRNLMASGTNPALLLEELKALGDCIARADTAGIPPLAELQADQCYLAWSITLTTQQGINAIKDVFLFVEDQSELSIDIADSNPAAAQSGGLPDKDADLQPAAAHPADTASAAPRPPRPPTRAQFSKDSTVRVPSLRLDRLVMLVGELVMNQSRLTQVTAAANAPNLTAPVEELERLVAELRDNVLGIRMMPIGTTFNHFKRLVHDLSAELHKEINLVTEGGDTELDKTVLDQLGDPLVHLIRNCIDHGIELADEREARGKTRHGTIRLAAVHTGSNVVVTIEDDGRGLDVTAIRAKAVEKKLIVADAILSKEEVFNLIFLPGFSTAKKVTSVSGRGVGMDVVQRQMDALRGSIQVCSDAGRGTSVFLTLPLTLAIIDGLMVGIGQDRFIIPMAAVAENVELPRAERLRHHGRNIVAVRGEQVPYIRLRDDFEIRAEEPENEKIVIVRHGNERVGLVVDRVLGSHQTVIQSLGRFYRDIEVVSGATIMGDGRVALILDIAGIIRMTDRSLEGAPSRVKPAGFVAA